MGKSKELKIGEEFNMLTVVGERYSKNGASYARFRCNCGVEKDILLPAVRSGKTKSCGCYNKTAASQRMVKYNTVYTSDTTHSLYQSFHRMKSVCSNPNVDGYCEGVKVIPEWMDYDTFYNWAIQSWFEGAVLTRKDKTKDFCPENCFFSTKSEVLAGNQNQEKARATCIVKYGKPYPDSIEIRNKRDATNLERYGFKTPLQSEEIKSKIRKTNLERYGCTNPQSLQKFRDKVKKTMLKKYGVAYPALSKEIRQKQIATCLLRYNSPYPKNITNREENSVKDFLNSVCDGFKPNHTILDGKEIDMYNEDLKLGIEYCGLYWHHENSKSKTPKNYHRDKYLDCLKNGVKLITIFSDEWIYRNKQVKNHLSSLVGKTSNRIFGRKCSIVDLQKSDGSYFVEENHIQGANDRAMKFFGLEYDDKIVGVMSFALHHRNNSDICLDRMCFADSTTVVGGASKLFSAGKEWAKSNGYNKIISWSDNRWSDGNIYKILGFTLQKELRADYQYVNISNCKKRISKQSMTKSKLGCPDNETEHEFALKLGFSRIWDCGKKTWVYTL